MITGISPWSSRGQVQASDVAGHPQVADDHIGKGEPREGDPLEAAGGLGHDVVPPVLQQLPELLAQPGIVVDHEDAGGGGHEALRSSARAASIAATIRR